MIGALARLSEADRIDVIKSLSRDQRCELNERWRGGWAHRGQWLDHDDWRVWVIMAGRGFGKTRAGAEWVSELARSSPDAQIALVGATQADVRQVMIEGPSGLIAVARVGEQVRYCANTRTVRFSSGARAYAYAAETPEQLRGPEHHAAWCDELAKWRRPATWDNLLMGLRAGDRPRVVVTTTPRPTALMRRVLKEPGLVVTHGRTDENGHLPAAFIDAMTATYGDTRLGRQELAGEMIEDVEGALWTRDMIESCRVAEAPVLVRVVVGVDPAVGGGGEGGGGDLCGIVAVGIDDEGVGHVLEDASVGGSPDTWVGAVTRCAARHRADRVVAEGNNGGALVTSALLAGDAELPLTLVHASRGKVARAEPVALLYERGRVKHVGAFAALEDELCGLVSGGRYAGPGRSPDRADALVWAVTALMLGKSMGASVRVLG
nr:terminase family protein [Sphingomonas jinjuensis]